MKQTHLDYFDKDLPHDQGAVVVGGATRKDTDLLNSDVGSSFFVYSFLSFGGGLGIWVLLSIVASCFGVGKGMVVLSSLWERCRVKCINLFWGIVDVY